MGKEKPSEERPAPRGLLGHLAAMLRPRAREHPAPPGSSGEEPRPVPARLAWDGIPLQLPAEGVGPLFHRRYQVDIDRPRVSARRLMARIQRDLAEFAPRELADFKKVKGSPRRMSVGDEFDITILGPWNGSVRVADVAGDAFTFVTLRGHPEAGEICFRLLDHPDRPRALRFQILSWARSRDMLVSLSYHEGKVGKEVQKNVWITFCERVLEASGGRQIGEIDVATEEREFQGEVVPLE